MTKNKNNIRALPAQSVDSCVLNPKVRDMIAGQMVQRAQLEGAIRQLDKETMQMIHAAAASQGMDISPDPAARYSYNPDTGLFARLFEEKEPADGATG